MKTLTDIVVDLISMMGDEERTTYLAAMAQNKRPTKPPRPMTDGESWWRDKLNLKHDKEWAIKIPSNDLVDEFIKHTGWSKSPHGAGVALGILLNKLCPTYRRHEGNLLLPNLDDARRAFAEVFPSPRVAGAGSASGGSGLPVNERIINMGPIIP